MGRCSSTSASLVKKSKGSLNYIPFLWCTSCCKVLGKVHTMKSIRFSLVHKDVVLHIVNGNEIMVNGITVKFLVLILYSSTERFAYTVHEA